MGKQTAVRAALSGRRWNIYPFIDIAIVLVCYAITFLVRTIDMPLPEPQPWTAYIIIALFAVVLFQLFGIYRRIWNYSSGQDVVVIVAAVGTASAVVLVVNYFSVPRPIPLSVIFVSSLLITCGTVGVRYRSRLISGFSWRWRAVWQTNMPTAAQRVLIIGAGEFGQILATRLQRADTPGYEVVGFVDDDLSKVGRYVESRPVLGTRQAIPNLVTKHRVDVIAVAIRSLPGAAFRDIISYCDQTNAKVKVIPDVIGFVDRPYSAPQMRDVQFEDLIGRHAIVTHPAVSFAPLQNKVILVTGAAGSIGSELIRQLPAHQPRRLLMLDQNESGLYDLQMEMRDQDLPVECLPILADITQYARIATVLETYKPDIIFHAAAYKHVPMLENYPHAALDVNVGGTLSLAALAQEHGVERLVLISTDKAVSPTSVMGATKRLCEEILSALAQTSSAATILASVRFGNVYGSRGSVVPLFLSQIERGGPVTVTDSEMTRYFMSIPEAVNLVLHAACMADGDDRFFLKMGERVRILDLAHRLIKLCGLRPEVDIPIIFTGMRPGEKLHEELFEETETASDTLHPYILRIDRPGNTALDADFLNRVRDLLADPPSSADEILAALKRLIDSRISERHVDTLPSL
jgi:FlaA1/EpsC-like NDP-sugar epimerase